MTDTTFSGADLTAHQPPGICPDCMKHGLEHTPTAALFCYCEHKSAGAYRWPGEPWTEMRWVSSEFFKKEILRVAMALEIQLIEALENATEH